MNSTGLQEIMVYLVNYNELCVYKCLLIKTYHVMVLLYNNTIMHLCPLFYFIINPNRRWGVATYITKVNNGFSGVRLMLSVILKKIIKPNNFSVQLEYYDEILFYD